eukprot:scaffold59889_cov63-Phaeocystis_antarctica.AAC.4
MAPRGGHDAPCSLRSYFTFYRRWEPTGSTVERKNLHATRRQRSSAGSHPLQEVCGKRREEAARHAAVLQSRPCSARSTHYPLEHCCCGPAARSSVL